MSAGCGSIATPSTLSEVLGGEGVSTHTVETVSTSLAPPHPLWDASGSFSYDARRSRRFSSESAFGMSVAPVAAIDFPKSFLPPNGFRRARARRILAGCQGHATRTSAGEKNGAGGCGGAASIPFRTDARDRNRTPRTHSSNDRGRPPLPALTVLNATGSARSSYGNSHPPRKLSTRQQLTVRKSNVPPIRPLLAGGSSLSPARAPVPAVSARKIL